MSWTDAIEDRWGGRHGTVRLMLRLLGLGSFGYFLIVTDAFGGSRWVALGTGLALAVSLALLLLRAWRPFDRWALVLTTVLMILGVVLNPSIENLGSVFFVLGGIILVGQPEVPIRIGAAITGTLSVGLVVRAVAADPQWTVLLTNLFGAVAVVLVGANRRQRMLRLRETARVTQLEQRTRLARDLHDVLAHSLGGLVVQLEAAGAELERGQTDAAAVRIRTSRQLAVEGLHEARRAVEELRTGTDRIGSVVAPVDLVDQLRAVLLGPVGLQLGAELEVVGDPVPVPPAVGEALVATAREALTNVNKHAAGAGRVSATIVFASNRVRLEIVSGLADSDGDRSDLVSSGGGAGLRGLRERMAAVGGRLEAGAEGRRWVTAAQCPVLAEATTRPGRADRR